MIFAGKYFLVSDQLFYNTFGEQLSYERIDQMIESQKKWEWIIYALTPIYYLIKFFALTACLSIGVLLFGYKVSTWKIFQVCIIAEFIFFIPSLGKIIWFSWLEPSYGLNDLNSFYFLSMLHFFNPSEVETWLVYPLQLINVFEILYFLILAAGMHDIVKQGKYRKMLGLVGSTYGVALLLWVVVVMFLTVSFSA